MRKEMDYKITQSEEYKAYMKALCRVASKWIPSIRVQFAEKAYEKFQDETTRRIVLAYGEEIEKHDEYMLRHFMWEAEKETPDESMLSNDILNNAGAFAETLFFLFDIKHTA